MSALELEPKLLGLVLVGGKSLRMKQPKAHLVIDEKPQWQLQQERLLPFLEEVYFSTSKNLLPPLSSSLLQIPDLFLEPIGPLGGMISAFKRYPDKAFFILACDMPHFDQEAISTLIEARDPQKKATLFVKDGMPEPLCGIYEPSVFKDLLYFFGIDVYCPQKIVQQIATKVVTPRDSRWLLNMNHDHEFLKLKECTKKEITVHYYASLRECSKMAHEVLKTDAQSVGQLFLELKLRYGFGFQQSDLRFAKNNQLVSAVCELEDKDEVVFIPPVSGG